MRGAHLAARAPNEGHTFARLLSARRRVVAAIRALTGHVAARAAVPPATAMKAVATLLAAVTLATALAVLVAVGAVAGVAACCLALRARLRTAAGDEGGEAIDVAVIARRLLLAAAL
jgi:hypothetical protein